MLPNSERQFREKTRQTSYFFSFSQTKPRAHQRRIQRCCFPITPPRRRRSMTAKSLEGRPRERKKEEEERQNRRKNARAFWKRFVLRRICNVKAIQTCKQASGGAPPQPKALRLIPFSLRPNLELLPIFHRFYSLSC